jgi:hypothetical protein
MIFLFLFGVFSLANECVNERAGLLKLVGNANFSTEWIETTQDDGKPLVIKMLNQKDKLYFIFDKSKEGIWAEGLIKVCKEKDKLIVKIAKEDIKVGSVAPWLIRLSMRGGAEFKLDLKEKDKMHVSITGWSGDFIPLPNVAVVEPKVEVSATTLVSPLPKKK